MKEGTWITILMKLLGSSKCFILVLFPLPDERRGCLSRILMKLFGSLKHARGKFKNPFCNTRNCFSSVTDTWWGKFRNPFCNTRNNFIIFFPIARWKEINSQFWWNSPGHRWGMVEANSSLQAVIQRTVHSSTFSFSFWDKCMIPLPDDRSQRSISSIKFFAGVILYYGLRFLRFSVESAWCPFSTESTFECLFLVLVCCIKYVAFLISLCSLRANPFIWTILCSAFMHAMMDHESWKSILEAIVFLKLEFILGPYKTRECYEIVPEFVLVESKMVDCRDRHKMVLICLTLPCVGQKISDMVTYVDC